MITHGYRLKMLNPFGGVKKIDKLLETDQLNQEFARLVEQITRRLLQAGLQGEEQFYEEVVKVTDEVLPCETTAIFILQNGEFQRMKVTTNLEAELPPEIYQPGEGLTGQALKRSSTGELSGQIFLYNTVSRKLHKNRVVEGNKTFLEIYQKQLPSGQVRHLLALPIYGPDYDKVVGILQVMNKLKHPSSTALSQVGFINRDVALLTIIATLVGNTLHNQHHLNRLKKLASISVGMESLTTPKKLYRYVAQEAAKVIGAEDCSIFRVDAAGEYLELVESLTTPPTDFGEHWRLRISQTPGCGLTAYVAASKKPEFFKGKEYKSHPACRDYHEHYRYLPSRDCHSLLIIPLLDFKGECLGVMRLTNKTQPDRINSFDQEDYEIAKTLGSQLANALRRETHFQHKNQQLKDFLKAQVKLLQLGQYGLEHLADPALALRKMVEGASDLLQADLVCLFPYDLDYQGQHGYDPKWVEVSPEGRLSQEEIKPPRPNGITARVKASEEGYAFIDLSKEPELRSSFLETEQIRSVLGVTMLADGVALGVLYFDYRRIPELSREDIRLARIVANLTALILHNAQISQHKSLKEWQLLKALEEHKILLDALHERLDVLSDQLDAPSNYATRYLSDLINQREVNPEEQLYKIEQAGSWMRTQLLMTERMLKMGQLDLEEPRFEQTDLIPLIDDVITEYGQEAHEKRIQLICDAPDNLPLIYGDDRFIYTILSNLVVNAINFTPPDGKVRLNSGLKDDIIYVDIYDTGVGIVPEERDLIFQKFYRGKKGGYGGTGIGCGLFYAQKFARLHNGSLRLINTHDCGSWFRLELPLALENPTSPSLLSPLAGWLSSS